MEYIEIFTCIKEECIRKERQKTIVIIQSMVFIYTTFQWKVQKIVYRENEIINSLFKMCDWKMQKKWGVFLAI